MSGALVLGAAAVALHVANYNFTARIEHATRVFTSVLGRNAVYFYAAFLVFSALVRDDFIKTALLADAGSLELLPRGLQELVGMAVMGLGFALNLWTLQALGIKGMYNGDSFGWLMDAPVEGGPFALFNDPQYAGTTFAMWGAALYYRSMHGWLLTAWMGFVFFLSVQFLEGPHMASLYAPANRKKNKLY
jgi:phosphatidylethanolamine/phosphatidyl-N-methylethanolamine N-methyltransferase